MFSPRIALLLVLAPLVGCDDIQGPDPNEGQENLSISPGQLDMKVGDIVALRINGVSTQLQAVWSSDNPEIASVIPTGFVRGNLAGRATITARVGDQSASVPVVVR
jgi:hypothetical protein